MSRNAYFTSQLIGFYFTINDCPFDVDVEHEAYATASKIHHQAYQLLEKTLPNQPFWIKQDAENPEFQHFPYELCEESHEYESHRDRESNKDLMAFSYWLYSNQRVEQEDAKAMLKEIEAAYMVSAAVLGGSVRLVGVQAQVTEQVVTTSEYVIDMENDPPADDSNAN